MFSDYNCHLSIVIVISEGAAVVVSFCLLDVMVVVWLSW